MSRTEHLVAAALVAFALAGCDDDTTGNCDLVNADGTRSAVRITGMQTCPPASRATTRPYPATHSVAGWYYVGSTAHYGKLAKDARPATSDEARTLQANRESQIESVRAINADVESNVHSAAEGHGGFGESGGHDGG